MIGTINPVAMGGGSMQLDAGRHRTWTSYLPEMMTQQAWHAA